MKLEERPIEDLHQLALYECRESPKMLKRINGFYRGHVKFLVAMIRRAGAGQIESKSAARPVRERR